MVENVTWERKEYIKESDNRTLKDVIKIRLRMQELKANYGRKGLRNRCPMCQSEKDTTEHVLECNKGDKKFNLKDQRGKEGAEILEVHRKKKENR